MRTSRQKESCCESRQILAEGQLKRTGCLKRQSDKERERPPCDVCGEAGRGATQGNDNARRGAEGVSSASGLRSIPDDLSAYADYFGEFFATNSAERVTVVPYVTPSFRFSRSSNPAPFLWAPCSPTSFPFSGA